MAPRPHCRKCRSAAVYKDTDALTGLVSIGCANCGNRWPGGYGFYMADNKGKEEPMAKEKKSSGHKIAPCGNCGRELPIMGHGLCGGCYGVYKKHKDDPAIHLSDALAEAKIRFTDPGCQRSGGIKTDARAEATADPVDAKPTAAKHEAFRQAAANLRQRLTKPDSPPHPDLMFIRIQIQHDDKPLIDEFSRICRRERRTMEGQILAMIDNLVEVSLIREAKIEGQPS